MDKDYSNPYARFKNHELTLNDYLAIDRTILSNERTLLAYVRAALAQVIIGGSALKFFDSLALTILGWIFIVAAIATMVIGWLRYRHTDHLLRAALLRQTGGEEHPLEEKVKLVIKDKDMSDK
jgi:putative membrane protein